MRKLKLSEVWLIITTVTLTFHICGVIYNFPYWVMHLAVVLPLCAVFVIEAMYALAVERMSED